MIPDKIYLNSPDGDYDVAEWNPIPYAKITTEYIRKDALLEWAKHQIEIAKVNNYAYTPYEKLIDKLNSL